MKIPRGVRWAPCLAVIGLAAIAGPRPLIAQVEHDTLRLESAITMAQEVNPALRANILSADAASERVSRVGALPDPMVMFGLMNWSISDFSPSEPMSMNAIQLSQRFPWPGKLGFSEERFEHLASAQRLDVAEAELQLVARVKQVYFQVASVDRSIAIMEDTRELLRDFLDIASTKYAVGTAIQQDVLQAQVAVAQMTEDITVMRENRRAMGARLNALLGRAATIPIGPVELPATLDGLQPVDSLVALAVASRPALAAAHMRTRAANAGYRAARRTLYPDLTLTLGYGHRPDFEDLFTVAVGFSIPLWAGSSQLALRREMEALESSADAKATELYNETYARLAELSAQAARARNLSELYSTSVLPQARAAVESALSAYRVGAVEYATLVQNQMTVNRYEIQMVQLAAEYHRAVAEINALTGGDLEVENE
ncbi:MAG: TolC family protein [Gemmatimonadota bacterium]|nr:MAG: TolC family protein [Gemmatimonadota bacterium]